MGHIAATISFTESGGFSPNSCRIHDIMSSEGKYPPHFDIAEKSLCVR